MAKNLSCQCGGGLGNLGTPNCVSQEKAKARDFFTPKYDSDGNRNAIKNTDFVNGVLPDSYIQGKLDEADASKRWYATPDIYEEIAPARTDRITQTSASGTIREITKGVKTFEGQLWNVPTSWSAQLNSGSCLDLATFSVDSEGKLCGEISDDTTEVYPRDIQVQSIVAEDFDATATEGQYTKITYQLAKTAKESNFFCYGTSALGADLLSVKSLIDAYIYQDESSVNSDTELFVKLLAFDYSPVVGYDDVADWECVDLLGAAAAISAVEETSNGFYKITIATTSGGVVLRTVKTRTSANAILYVAGGTVLVTP